MERSYQEPNTRPLANELATSFQTGGDYAVRVTLAWLSTEKLESLLEKCVEARKTNSSRPPIADLFGLASDYIDSLLAQRQR